ncbi:hypothetical protein B0T14DRAFT_171291 [Immersiella caudata]|uniref:BRCT domain-containing protein n=1 Tax=Immersiella caudata TaxID=314043 RepID=A0AA39WX63_9PEZI|nr:hypothetical protein B0T14DRAFT_171291 [Immersiella caudata]
MPRSSANPKPIFTSLVIATAAPLGGQFKDLDLNRWITYRSGRYSLDMDESVTHLVVPDTEFKTTTSNPRVRAALKTRGKIKIVTKDWLEDCMTEGRRLDTKGFELGDVVKKERKKERERKKMEKGADVGLRGVDYNLFHVYYDETFFRYAVTIVNEEGARYEMTLYESNTSRPHLYWFSAKFYKRKGDSSPHYYRPSPCSGLFWREYVHFETFFLKKTGIPWDKRLLRGWKGGKGKFWYEPPTGGKPVGYVPVEYMPEETAEAEWTNWVRKDGREEGGGRGDQLASTPAEDIAMNCDEIDSRDTGGNNTSKDNAEEQLTQTREDEGDVAQIPAEGIFISDNTKMRDSDQRKTPEEQHSRNNDRDQDFQIRMIFKAPPTSICFPALATHQ